MISVAIERTSLSLADLTISDTTGDYVLMPGFSVGGPTPENVYAESRWVSGAAVTSTRMTMTGIELVVRVAGTDLDDLQSNIDALAAALTQWYYTVEVTEGTTVTTYECCPGVVRRAFNRFEMRQFRDIVTAQIPRQP